MDIKIGSRLVGDTSPVFIVAELSANHLQNYKLAVKTIKAMARAGADAVKLQTYTPDTITIKSNKDIFRIKQGTVWDGKTLYELYQGAYSPWSWQVKLKKLVEDLGMVCFSSFADESAVDFLEELQMPAYKLPSFEITAIPLIKYVASKGKPVILATGISELKDIKLAVETCYAAGNKQIIILKCTSSYPAPLEETNLRTIPDLAKRFKTVVGLSDHTLGPIAATTAVALGAKVIEKHFILDRNLGGPDAGFSMEPAEFQKMVQAIRQTEEVLGHVSYKLSNQVKKNREFCQSLFIVKSMKTGDRFTNLNVRSIRPGFGLHPKHINDILGKKIIKDTTRGTPLSWDLVNRQS